VPPRGYTANALDLNAGVNSAESANGILRTMVRSTLDDRQQQDQGDERRDKGETGDQG